MSVSERITDAEVLWKAGRVEGAVVQVLIAFAGTVRKRYPRPEPDGTAFAKFIHDEIGKITNGPTENVRFFYAGTPNVSLEDIVYKAIRCNLVHEGQLPSNIELTSPEAGDGKPFGGKDGRRHDGRHFNRLALYDVLGFPIGWIWNLVRVVAEAPENTVEFPCREYPIPAGYSVNAGLKLDYPDEHPERFPPNAAKLSD